MAKQFYLTHRWDHIRDEIDMVAVAMNGYFILPKAHIGSHIIIWRSIISGAVVGGEWSYSSAVGVFYNPRWLGCHCIGIDFLITNFSIININLLR